MVVALPDPSGADTGEFSNPAPIVMTNQAKPDACVTSCLADPASPYPSPVTVTGLSGTISDANVVLRGFTQESPSDVDVLLVAPDGTNAIIMSDACGDNTNANPIATAIDLTLDDQAAAPLPADAACTTGTFQPVNDSDSGELPEGFMPQDRFRVPGTCCTQSLTTSGATALSTFNGGAANGTWNLYVIDDFPADPVGQEVGRFNGGWTLQLTTAGVVTTTTEPTSTTTLPPGATTTTTTLPTTTTLVATPTTTTTTPTVTTTTAPPTPTTLPTGQVSGGAFGFQATASLGTTTANEGPRPAVQLPAGGSASPVTASAPQDLAELGPVVLFQSGQLDVSTQGTPTSGVTSSAAVQSLNQRDDAIVSAQSLRSDCQALASGTSGSARFTGGQVVLSQGGSAAADIVEQIPADPAPNTSFNGRIESVGDTYRVVVNEQQVSGGSIIVNAVHVYMLGPVATGDIIVGQSRCGFGTAAAPLPENSPTAVAAPVAGPTGGAPAAANPTRTNLPAAPAAGTAAGTPRGTAGPTGTGTAAGAGGASSGNTARATARTGADVESQALFALALVAVGAILMASTRRPARAVAGDSPWQAARRARRRARFVQQQRAQSSRWR